MNRLYEKLDELAKPVDNLFVANTIEQALQEYKVKEQRAKSAGFPSQADYIRKQFIEPLTENAVIARLRKTYLVVKRPKFTHNRWVTNPENRSGNNLEIRYEKTWDGEVFVECPLQLYSGNFARQNCQTI